MIMKWVGHVTCIGKINAYRNLERKCPGHTNRWGGVKILHKRINWECGMDSSGLG
jgi:hypothetical protein